MLKIAKKIKLVMPGKVLSKEVNEDITKRKNIISKKDYNTSIKYNRKPIYA